MLKIPKPAETPEMPALKFFPIPTHKEIRTVIKYFDGAIYYDDDFDTDVNKLLEIGWELKRRDIITVGGKVILYAELERVTNDI